MNVKNANEIFQHKIVNGSDFGWSCYPNARLLDYEADNAFGSIVFSTVDQTVYEATVDGNRSDGSGQVCYRWINPQWADAMYSEAKDRDADVTLAYDDFEWIDLDLWEDFAKKASAMFRGEEWDERIMIEVDLPDDIRLKLYDMAHEQDITFNQLVSNIVSAQLAKHEATKNKDVDEIEHSHFYYDTDRNR